MWENKEEFLNQKIEVIEPVFEGTKTYILDDMLQHVGEKETIAFLLKNRLFRESCGNNCQNFVC